MPGLQQQLFSLLSEDIGKAALLAGNYTADERMAAFLISLSRRYAARGFSATRFRLTMTRTDIANYLRLASESVSRGFVDSRMTVCCGSTGAKSSCSDRAALGGAGAERATRLILRVNVTDPPATDLGQSATASGPAASTRQPGRCIMSASRRLWVGLAVLLLVSFGVLLWVGGEIHRVMPPIPAAVVATTGETIYTRADIEKGRQVWQSIGGQQLGSIWGHGSYVAPDWTRGLAASRSAGLARHRARRETSKAYADLAPDAQASVRRATAPAHSREHLRRRDAHRHRLGGPRRGDRARAAHYTALFGNDPQLLDSAQSVCDEERHRTRCRQSPGVDGLHLVVGMGGRHRASGPGHQLYHNWPHEPLVGNTPPPHLLMWTVFSVLFLIGGIALLGWHHARHKDETPAALPASDPLAMIRMTPSMRATAKYFWLVIALFLAQILLGAITAHYQVEGQEAYGFALSNVLPYSLRRTWHTQLAVLWIAIAWLGTGLYIGPAISDTNRNFSASA